MKIVLAPDSFKECLTSPEVCHAMKEGISRIREDIEILFIPMADGGEGTVEALVASTGGKIVREKVTGPLLEPVQASYGLLGDGNTAVIEMAAASGLGLVPKTKRDPTRTTTYGTGELMRSALSRGCRNLVIGIGGSATTDCGAGMAQVMGVRFYRKDGTLITEPMNGTLMGEVYRLEMEGLDPRLKKAEITVACDVDNPLLGPRGAVEVFSRQKGATEEQILFLEKNMKHFISRVEDQLGRKVRDTPGAGAAGGLGAGLMAFTGGVLKPGVDIVLNASRFKEKITGADLILTGEGRVDIQTGYGKTVSGILREAKKQNVPVIVLAGALGEESQKLYESGATAMFAICPGPITLEESMTQAGEYLAATAERVVRTFLSGKK